MNKNPFAWFLAIMILGFFYVSEGQQWFIVFVLAVILAKQVEIIEKINKK